MFVYMFNRQGETEAETVKIRFCGQSGGKRRSHISGEFLERFHGFQSTSGYSNPHAIRVIHLLLFYPQ